MIKKEKYRYHQEYFYYIWGMACIFLSIFFSRVVTGENDIPAHTQFAETFLSKGTALAGPIQAKAYPFYHLCQKLFAFVFRTDYYTSAAVLLVLANIFMILIVRYILRQIVEDDNVTKIYLIDVVSIASPFFGVIRGILTEGRFYAWQSAPNIVHNPTVIFLKPFFYLIFFLFVRILQKLLRGEACKKEMAAYSLLCAVSCFVKPSCAFVLLPAFALATLFCIFKNRKIVFALKILALTIPSVIIMWWQAFICFPDQSEGELQGFSGNYLLASANENFNFLYNGSLERRPDVFHGEFIRWKWGSFANFTTLEVICVSFAMLLIPCMAIIIYRKKRELKSDAYLWIMALVAIIGWVQMFCLSNGIHGDISWGYSLAVNLATVIGLAYFIKYKTAWWIKTAVSLIFAYQCLCGLYYYWGVYSTGQFWF